MATDFGDIFERDYEKLKRLARCITAHEQDAEDAVNNAMEKLLSARTENVLHPVGYAFRAVIHAAHDINRKKRRQSTLSHNDLETLIADSTTTLPDEEVDVKYDRLLKDALTRLSPAHQAIIQLFLDHDCDAGPTLDALVAQEGGATDEESRKKARNNQKVRLKAARDRLSMLVRLGRIDNGCPKTLEALSELLLQGEEHYDEVDWGLKRSPEGFAVRQARLQQLVHLGCNLHKAVGKGIGLERFANVLGPQSPSWERLRFKYGSGTRGNSLRTNRMVADYFATHDVGFTLELLRASLSCSHLQLLVAEPQVPEAVLQWAQTKQRAVCDPGSKM
jgi:RNA polymerase sigma factor (sigma-70 family)